MEKVLPKPFDERELHQTIQMFLSRKWTDHNEEKLFFQVDPSIVTVFKESFSNSVREIREAFAASDSKRVSFVAHRLKSGAGYLRMQDLYQLLDRIEKVGEGLEPGNLRQLVEDLEKNFDRLETKKAA